jgi:exopolysaccharide biosynthesis polyprenyl glycosylphosphotransferase
LSRLWLHKAQLVLLDLSALLLGLFLAFQVWTWWSPQLDYIVQIRFGELFLPNPWMPPAALLIPAWLVSHHLTGLFRPGGFESSPHIASMLFKAATWEAIFLGAIQFLLIHRFYSRFLILAFLGAGFLFLLIARVTLFKLQSRLPSAISLQNVVIFGVGGDALLMADRIRTYGRHAYRHVGYLRPSGEHLQRVPEEEILGGLDDLPRLVNKRDLQIVILATRRVPRDEAMRLATRCERMGLRILQMPFTWGFASPRLAFASLGGLQLIDLQYLSYPTFVENLKRVFDLLCVSFGGLLLLPFLLATGLAIRLDSPGPSLYVSPRMGKGGRIFPFYKFRSMVVGADAMKEALRDRNEADGVLFKMREDPRVTRVGRFIRTYSIDEFPQLLNVLRGDMNLVGPRPLPVADLQGIEADPEAFYWFELRSKVKPGITGLWQVMGRSNLGFADMVALDIQYIQNWSLWQDILILLRTIPAVIRGRGAS